MGSIRDAQRLFLCLCIVVLAVIGPSVSSEVTSLFVECDGMCVVLYLWDWFILILMHRFGVSCCSVVCCVYGQQRW